jgi:hypothetical protein
MVKREILSRAVIDTLRKAATMADGLCWKKTTPEGTRKQENNPTGGNLGCATGTLGTVVVGIGVPQRCRLKEATSPFSG